MSDQSKPSNSSPKKHSFYIAFSKKSQEVMDVTADDFLDEESTLEKDNSDKDRYGYYR